MAADKEAKDAKRAEKAAADKRKDALKHKPKKTVPEEATEAGFDLLATICEDLTDPVPSTSTIAAAPVVQQSAVPPPVQQVMQPLVQPAVQPTGAPYGVAQPQHYVLDSQNQFVPAQQFAPQFAQPPGIMYYTQPQFHQEQSYEDYSWYDGQQAPEEVVEQTAEEPPAAEEPQEGGEVAEEDTTQDELLVDLLGELTKTEDGPPISPQLAVLADKLWLVSHDLNRSTIVTGFPVM